MRIDETTVGEVTVLALDGRLVVGEGDLALRERINALAEAGCRKLVLDLEKVPFVDSAGLGEVVRTRNTLNKLGGEVRLLKPTQRLRDLLKITRLDVWFQIFEDGEAASRF
jgi:anti-anti-sigma factor